MMLTLNELSGDDVLARDGKIGTLADLYLEGEDLAVRFLAVATPEERLLLEPGSVESELTSGHKLRLALTLDQARAASRDDAAAPGLRSGARLVGYEIRARDGTIGEVQDLVFDADRWELRELVVDTLKWWPGGLVRVHPAYIARIDAAARCVHLLLTRDEVKRSGSATPRS